MGTSSSYKPPTTGNWPSAKATLTRFVSQGGTGPTSAGDVISSYVEAHGGARKLASSSGSAQAVARRLAQFVVDVHSDGIERALRKHGLQDLVGRDIGAILDGLLDYIAPDANLRDEVLARKTADDVLAALLEGAESDEAIELLVTQKLDTDGILSVIEMYVEAYVYNKLIADFGSRIAEQSASRAEARRVEKELRRVVRDKIQIHIARAEPSKIDWLGAQGGKIMNQIFQDACRMIE